MPSREMRYAGQPAEATAITLPAVLVGGWYGMNFDHMPELHSPHGYLYAGVLTIVSTVCMAIYLKKKKWF